MKSFLWSVIIKSTSLFFIIFILLFSSFLALDLYNLKSNLEKELDNGFMFSLPSLRQNLLLGDYITIKNNLNLWAKNENITGSMVDNSNNIIWNFQSHTSNFKIKKIYPIAFEGDSKIAEIYLIKDFSKEVGMHILKYLKYSIYFLIVSLSLILIFVTFLYKSLYPIRILRDQLLFESKSYGLDIPTGIKNELEEIQFRFANLTKAWQFEKENTKRLSRIQAFSDIAKQVAHDIRSPLSALNIITGTLTDVPEEKRLLIRNSVQRINDIANDLLQKGKSTQNSAVSEVKNDDSLLKKNCSFLISTVIDNIISEKRIQYREKIGVSINVDLKNSFGLFVYANPNELSRVISNLINNSVEALLNHSGNIDVSVFNATKNKVSIQIKDNGSGIPKHILAKLGQAGVSHGKDNSQSGSGLGVYHAMKTIQDFGGQIIYQSVTSEDLINSDFNINDKFSSFINAHSKTGTSITIELPKADTPSWFAESIQLKFGQEIVTVDDDISIHQIWKGRLESLKANVQNIKLTSFTSAKEFREYFNKNLKSVFNTSNESTGINSDNYSDPDSTVVFLIDYEFLNQNDNGLKIITDLGIQDKAILVTSRFDEPNIRSECEVQKIKILPKQLAGQIGISIMPSFDHSTNEIVSFENTNLSKAASTINNHPVSKELSKYDLCLLDDDKSLVHSIWGMVAKEKGLNIKMFERPEDFLSEADSIDKATPLYVDVSLGNNVNGIDVAKTIHEQGFENINLATGYDSETIKVPSFIRQVVGKDFPL